MLGAEGSSARVGAGANLQQAGHGGQYRLRHDSMEPCRSAGQCSGARSVRVLMTLNSPSMMPGTGAADALAAPLRGGRSAR